MAENIIDLSEATFEPEVKKETQKFVLVDFWASWCMPCLVVAPVLEKIAKSYSDRLKICKLNIDDNHKIASDLGVMSIPTLMLFKDGKEQERIVGALGEEELTRRLEKYIG